MSELILRHVEAFFQGHEIDEFTGMEGTIAKSLPGFEVIRVKPKK